MKYRANTILLLLAVSASAQDVARAWNEVTLEAIRNDFARPTVHARNLFHTSIAMYDAWALFDPTAETYLIGKQNESFISEFDPNLISNFNSDQREVASYAVYRLLYHRFSNSPGALESEQRFDSLMNVLGYDTELTSIDYSDGSASSLGNFIAEEIIRFGLQDGSNEQIGYTNTYYEPVNDPLVVQEPGNPTMTDPNRWQPLAFEMFIDQSGNVIPGEVPDFLSPEWGNVLGFATEEYNMEAFTRDGADYIVYENPGSPPLLGTEENEPYQWGFSMVAKWASHLDPDDGVEWDISPRSIGNIQSFPEDTEEYPNFYLKMGGDPGQGHAVNPVTGQPYEEQLVKRGDYARVLAEFWADGPDSETPPGHWFTILNYVMDQPDFTGKFMGEFDLDRFEYQVKAYFLLGAAMHDVAITAWGLKGWYDYVRPISAIRYMARLGQSSDNTKLNYHYQGIPLEEGLIEIVEEGDLLVKGEEDIGKIKLYTWRGPDFIQDPELDVAGVGWILAENWWPYQRPSFVTPPFAGFVSGHSTYSRAAADILTFITGDPFFPGGLGEFIAKKNEFLVFEEGPSEDIILQWATYQDASDQCSLSRIWGGIHPPADDIPGRKIGMKIASIVSQKAMDYFTGNIQLSKVKPITTIYPNPVKKGQNILITGINKNEAILLYHIDGRLIKEYKSQNRQVSIETINLEPGVYLVKSVNEGFSQKLIIR